MPDLRIVDTGWSSTIQDLGRFGFAAVGVPTAGAVDPDAHRFANRLVGNPPDAATLETSRGLVVEACRPLIVATSGAGWRQTLHAGERLSIDAPTGSMWAYLAVRGGIDVEPVLGSRSRDTLSGLGPADLEAGTELAIGPDPRSALTTDLGVRRRPEAVVQLWEGPRADWFEHGTDELLTRIWKVQSDVSRVGVRLEAGRFERSERAVRMPSEGLVHGAVQITPSGEPIIMLANHPTTGGYPVIGVVEPADLSMVAQARPGSTLRFRSS